MQSLQRIPLSKIVANPDQPRKHFDAGELDSLASSIRSNGLMQPIKVRPRGRQFEIVMGERRFRAHCLLAERGHLPDRAIDCLVQKMTDTEMAVRAIVENIARVDLTVLEEAKAYADLLQLDFTEEEAAAKCGVRLQRFRERLSLLTLDPSISALLSAGQLDAHQATQIARLPNHADQRKLLRALNRGELKGYRAVDRAVEAVLEGVTQADIFGDAAPRANARDIATVTAMEAKIEQIGQMVAAGWKDGECIIANKVSPDRAAMMADKLAAIRTALAHMARDLRHANAQVRMTLSE